MSCAVVDCRGPVLPHRRIGRDRQAIRLAAIEGFANLIPYVHQVERTGWTLRREKGEAEDNSASVNRICIRCSVATLCLADVLRVRWEHPMCVGEIRCKGVFVGEFQERLGFTRAGVEKALGFWIGSERLALLNSDQLQ